MLNSPPILRSTTYTVRVINYRTFYSSKYHSILRFFGLAKSTVLGVLFCLVSIMLIKEL